MEERSHSTPRMLSGQFAIERPESARDGLAMTHDSSSMSSSVSPPAAELERIMNSITIGINQQRFNQSDPLYSGIIDFQRWSSQLRLPSEEVYDWHGYGQHMLNAHRHWPGYSVSIKRADCYFEDNDCFASSFAMFETRGRPEGVVRPSVAVLRFEKQDGAWKCFYMKIMDGVQGGDLL